MTPKITQVEARSRHRLHVRFENGEERVFDVTPYLDRGVFRELRDETYFRRVRSIRGGVEWPHEQDLSADSLYHAGVPDTPSPPDLSSRREDRSRRPSTRHEAQAEPH